MTGYCGVCHARYFDLEAFTWHGRDNHRDPFDYWCPRHQTWSHCACYARYKAVTA